MKLRLVEEAHVERVVRRASLSSLVRDIVSKVMKRDFENCRCQLMRDDVETD
jgi:hypothetical protein